MNQNFSEQLFQTIDTIIEKRLEEVVFDEIIQCTVVRKTSAVSNEYEVKNNSIIYKAIAKDGEQYRENDNVCVSFLKNSDEKIILGKYTLSQEEALEYQDPFDKFIIDKTMLLIQSDDTDAQPIIKLSTDISDDAPVSKTIDLAPINNQSSSLQGYDFMGLEFGINVSGLPPKASGDWAIGILLLDKNNNPLHNMYENNTMTPYLLSSDEVYGNPYALTTNFTQRKLFHFPHSLQLSKIHQIRLVLYQSGNFSGIGELIVENFQMTFGYDVNKYLDKPIHLYIEGEYNGVYSYINSTQVNGLEKPDIHALLIDQKNKTIIKELPEGQSLRWYQYKINEPGDEYGGGYWKYIENDGLILPSNKYILNMDRPNSQIKAVLCEDRPSISFDVNASITVIFDDRRKEEIYQDSTFLLSEADKSNQYIIYQDNGITRFTYWDQINSEWYYPTGSDESKSIWDWPTNESWLANRYSENTWVGTIAAVINLQENVNLRPSAAINYYQYKGENVWEYVNIYETEKTVIETSVPFVFERLAVETIDATGLFKISATFNGQQDLENWILYDHQKLNMESSCGLLSCIPLVNLKQENIIAEKIKWEVIRQGQIKGIKQEDEKDVKLVLEYTIDNDTISAPIEIILQDQFDSIQATRSNNIIKCTINDRYTTMLNLSFVDFSSQGTNFNFWIEPIGSYYDNTKFIDNNYLLNAVGATQQFQAYLTTSDGTKLDVKNYNITWDWAQESNYHPYDLDGKIGGAVYWATDGSVIRENDFTEYKYVWDIENSPEAGANYMASTLLRQHEDYLALNDTKAQSAISYKTTSSDSDIVTITLEHPFDKENFQQYMQLPTSIASGGNELWRYLFKEPVKKFYSKDMDVLTEDPSLFTESNIKELEQNKNNSSTVTQYMVQRWPTIQDGRYMSLSLSFENGLDAMLRKNEDAYQWVTESTHTRLWLEIPYCDINSEFAKLVQQRKWSNPKEKIYNVNILRATCEVNALQYGSTGSETKRIKLISKYPIKIIQSLDPEDIVTVKGPAHLTWSETNSLETDISTPFEIMVNSSPIESIWSIIDYKNQNRYNMVNNQLSFANIDKQGFENTEVPIAFMGQYGNDNFVQVPLLTDMNIYSTSMTNEWAGDSVYINDEKATIMATALGAGVKEPYTNLFSGILLGQFSQNGEIMSGLAGFAKGRETFSIDAETGEGIFSGVINAIGGTIADWSFGTFEDGDDKYNNTMHAEYQQYRTFLRSRFYTSSDVFIGIKKYPYEVGYPALQEGQYLFYAAYNGSVKCTRLFTEVDTSPYDLTVGNNYYTSIKYQAYLGRTNTYFGFGHHYGDSKSESIQNCVGLRLRETDQITAYGGVEHEIFLGYTFPTNIARNWSTSPPESSYGHYLVSRYGSGLYLAALIGTGWTGTNATGIKYGYTPAKLYLGAINAGEFNAQKIVSSVGPSIIQLEADEYQFIAPQKINSVGSQAAVGSPLKLYFSSDGSVKWVYT